MTPGSDFDVVVAGAGPAGTAAAICCCRAGLRVAILDRAEFPRFHVGESLHPGVEVLLRQLGAAATALKPPLVRYDGVWIEKEGSRKLERFGSDRRSRWRGFQVDRARFDQALLGKAHESGAVVWQPCGINHVMRAGSTTIVDSHQGQLRSRVVVDATGSRRWVASQFGLESVCASPRIIARYGYRAGEARTLSHRPVFTLRQDGWQWIARVGSGVYQWIRAYISPHVPRGNDVPIELRECVESAPTRSVDVSWRILREPAHAGFFAVGDAAAMLDPSSSHGVLRALSSGIMAAHCIQAALLRGADATAVARVYSRWTHRWFNEGARRLGKAFPSASVGP